MDRLALIFTTIGALIWGCIGVFAFDPMYALFGSYGTVANRIIFALVGLAGLWCLSLFFRRNAVTTEE